MLFGKLKKFPYKGLFPFERFPFYDYELYPNCRKGVPKNDGTSNPVFDAMLLAAISFGGKERKKTEDFVSETQLLLV